MMVFGVYVFYVGEGQPKIKHIHMDHSGDWGNAMYIEAYFIAIVLLASKYASASLLPSATVESNFGVEFMMRLRSGYANLVTEGTGSLTSEYYIKIGTSFITNIKYGIEILAKDMEINIELNNIYASIFTFVFAPVSLMF
jgi:hypothetical protein